MNEFIYKLNLPGIDNIIERSKLLETFRPVPVNDFDPAKVVKPEWRTVKGYTFNSIVVFYRPNGLKSNIHSDTEVATVNGYSWNFWAINWIYGGWGTMEYWNKEDIVPIQEQEQSHSRKFVVPCYSSNVEPVKKYVLKPGAYLVRIDQPHQAIGYNNRYTFSFRTAQDDSLSWEKIVNDFQDLILDDPLK